MWMGHLPVLTDCALIFELNNSNLFRYFQLWNFAKTHYSTFPQIPPATGTDHVLMADTITKGKVSYLYDLLLPTNESVIEKIRAN